MSDLFIDRYGAVRAWVIGAAVVGALAVIGAVVWLCVAYGGDSTGGVVIVPVPVGHVIAPVVDEPVVHEPIVDEP